MKLLYVGRLPPQHGGSTILAADVLASLVARGHRACVLSGVPAADRATRRAFIAAHPNMRMEEFELPYFSGARGLAILDETYRAAEGAALRRVLPDLIDRERPDVVIVGQESAAWHVPTLVRACGVPVVLWVQGGSTFMGLVGQYPGVVDLARLREQFHAASLVVTVAEHLTAELRRLGLRALRTVPNAVDLNRFTPQAPSAALRAKLGLPTGEFVAMHLSTLKPIKRPHDFVDGGARVLARGQLVHCVVVGDGAMREPVERQCAARGVLERFRFTGWIGREEVPQYLSVADAVVSTSVHEGQSLVCLEAQACGRLVVASNIPGARELVVDGETGLLFEVGDVGGLAEALLRAACDPALRERLGRQARRARETYPFEAMVAAHERALTEVAGSGSR